MLQLLDDALESYFRSEVGLPTGDVDLSFTAPDGDWATSLTRPTVNIYLWDLHQSSTEASSGVVVAEHDGTKVRRRPPARVDCSYLITAWTNDVRDEHQLLGALLRAALIRRHIPPDHLPESLAATKPGPTLTITRADQARTTDFWSALGGRLKPALDLTVAITVDAELLRAVGPPVYSQELQVTAGAAKSRRRRAGGFARGAAGVFVRGPRGGGRVHDDGEFTVPARAGERITLESSPEAETEAPDRGPIEFD